MKFDKFITRPVLSSAISIFIVVLGVLGIVSLPITQYPSIAPPTIQVEATYTGANAQTVLNSVIAPLEEEINGVENMTYMTSTATNTGTATILVYFKQGTDPDMAAVNVQNKVSKAEGSLPSEVTKIGVTTSKRQSSMLMGFGLYSDNDQYDYSFLENYANINLIPQIKRISGVSDVFITGSNYSMRIWLKPDVMAQYHLMPSDITTALNEQNIEAAPGQLGEQGNQTFQYVLKYKGRLQNEIEFENIVISATKDGEVLHLKDVAKIELGRLSNSVTSNINGHPGVTGMIFQTTGSNAMDINNSIASFLKQAKADFPDGVEVATLLNTNDFLYASIWEVIKTLLEAFILVILVTYVFLQNSRSTLIPTIAIPVSLIGSFFLMWIFGFSVNLLTLCAMVLAIGTVVDDAIIAIGISGINALTLSPALCALLLKPNGNNGEKKTTFAQRFHNSFNDNFNRITAKYKKGVGFFTSHKLISGSFVGIVIIAFVILLRITPTGLIPNEDQGTIFGALAMPVGTSLEETTKEMDKISEVVKSIPAIQQYSISNGYSLIDGSGNTYGNLICNLKDWDLRGDGESVDEIIAQLYRETAKVVKNGNMMYLAPPMVPGYSVTNGFELKLQDKTGGDLTKFETVAKDFIQKLNQRPEIESVRTSFSSTTPQYMVDVDVEKCKIAGISPDVVLSTLEGYYGGIYASNFNRFGKLYRVMIQASPDYRTNTESLNKIMVRNGSEMAPISQFVTLRKAYGPDNITRFNMYTSIGITGSPADGYSSGEAISAINELAKELPTGYSYEFSGMTREESTTDSNSTAIILGIVFLFFYLLLSMQYESYILPVIIMLSIPMGLSGSLLFANIMGVNNNIYLQIALIMLIGLIAKNSILIVEYAIERRQHGLSIMQAAIEAAAARLRPIMMTSLTLIVGLLPMMFASGVGANGNSSLGTGVIGGMLIGLICQIFITPALFVIFQKIQEKFKPLNEDLGQTTSTSGLTL